MVAVSLVVFVSWLCCTQLSLLMKFSVLLLIKKRGDSNWLPAFPSAASDTFTVRPTYALINYLD